jgi:hypothetical protein
MSAGSETEGGVISLLNENIGLPVMLDVLRRLLSMVVIA